MGWINASEIFQLETRRILESDGGVMTLEKEWMVLDIRSNMEYLVRITRRFLKLYRAHRTFSFLFLSSRVDKFSNRGKS
jgi:hypothetical protein